MPRNILVVDANSELREVLKTLLELDGHLVRVAKDGAEAIARMGERLAAFVVIAEDLPDISGSHLALHLKALAETLNPKHRCIAIAIRGDIYIDEATLLDGFDHLLYKPVAYEQISALLAPS